MSKSGKKGGSFVWGFVFLGFAVGVLIAAIILKYGGFLAHVPEKMPLPPLPPVPEAKVEVPLGPRVAIVIDDMGLDIERLRELFGVGAELTVAVLPNLRHSRLVSTEANGRGWEVLLHLPMEPKNTGANDPGTGALKVSMGADDVRAIMTEDLASVPHASGVNNHMGSRFTEEERLMKTVLDVVKSKDMFFLDSRTTPGSVAGRLAREMGVRELERDVFLDNTRSPEYIRGQLEELVRIARKRGKAVAIGHPYPETIETLKEFVPGLKADGVEVVRLSSLVD